MGPVDTTPAPYGCRHCSTSACFTGNVSRMPDDCPTRLQAATAKDVSAYHEPARRDLMRVADETPMGPDRALRTRVEELIFFAQARGMRRIGIAHCVTLRKEAQSLARKLESAGIEADLVCCRVGAVDSSEIGLEKAHPERFAAICNPVAQARLLDARGVDLVVQMGLCLGHDIILQQECRAPVTTLVVKDRVLDHHPIRALRD